MRSSGAVLSTKLDASADWTDVSGERLRVGDRVFFTDWEQAKMSRPVLEILKLGRPGYVLVQDDRGKVEVPTSTLVRTKGAEPDSDVSSHGSK